MLHRYFQVIVKIFTKCRETCKIVSCYVHTNNNYMLVCTHLLDEVTDGGPEAGQDLHDGVVRGGVELVLHPLPGAFL